VLRGCIHVFDEVYERRLNKCVPYSLGGIQCLCDWENCNGEQMDALVPPDSDSPETTVASPDLDALASRDSDSPGTTDASIAPPDSPDSSGDSLKSADPEMIVLLISVVITFML